MIRKAFKMSVHPDRHEEYERRHTPIWVDLQQVLHEHGVRSYSIYLDPETSELFGYAEL
jgi:L-rhamnose mutarotase